MIVTNPTAIDATAKATASQKAAVSETAGKQSLGQDEFLTLLITQLKNQDPTNPMDHAQFTQQMAQFSSLEQLMNINENLGSLQVATNATNSAQAVNMIGKEVKAEGDNVHVSAGIASPISFELGQAADSVVISVEDPYGNVIRTIEEGTMSSGPHTVKWNGKDELGTPLEDGLYKYTVSASDTEGTPVEVSTFTRGVVSAVSFENGVGYIHIGDLKYMLSEILEVKDADTAPAAADTGANTGSGTLSGALGQDGIII